MRKHLEQKNRTYLANANARFNLFKERWPKMKTSRRLIIHLPSLGYPINVRESMGDIAQLQNRQLGRICDVKDPNVEVRIITSFVLSLKIREWV